MQQLDNALMKVRHQVGEALRAHRDTCPADKASIPPLCRVCRELWYAMRSISQAAQHLEMAAREEMP